MQEFVRSVGGEGVSIVAKVERLSALTHVDAIVDASDGIILSRGNLGLDMPPEKVFLSQKMVLHKCNNAGKPAVITRVVDTMTETPRPTRAEATDVANAVLDGADAIMLGAETLPRAVRAKGGGDGQADLQAGGERVRPREPLPDAAPAGDGGERVAVAG